MDRLFFITNDREHVADDSDDGQQPDSDSAEEEEIYAVSVSDGNSLQCCQNESILIPFFLLLFFTS